MRLADRLYEIAANAEEVETAEREAPLGLRGAVALRYSYLALDLEGVAAEVGRRVLRGSRAEVAM